jgi:outer membrane protein assembly factor BamB
MLSLFLLTLAAAPADNWTAFHGGPLGGVRHDVKLPHEWSLTKNVAWSVDIPGLAWSSPVTWNGKIFLTTAIREGKPELPNEAKKGLYMGGEKSKPPEESYTWKVLCIDEQTGKVLWEKVTHQGKAARPKHIKNTYASETPVVDAERLYVCFGDIGIFAYDHQGNEAWKFAIPALPTKFNWGPAASPTVHKDRLFFVYDNEKESFIVCLDAKTGSQLWKQPRDEKSNWATPFVWENGLRTEVVTAGTKRIRSYDLDGKLLWEAAGMSNITVPTPFSADGLLYVGSGYVMDTKKPLYAIKPGATGDITLKKDETKNDFVVWAQPKAASYMPTPIVYQGRCYVLYDMGTLACYDAKTGEVVFDKKRFPGKSSGFTSSPWAYDGKVFCLNEDGDTYVMEAGTEFKVICKNSLEELCMATPAITDKSLLIRTATKLYCIR